MSSAESLRATSAVRGTRIKLSCRKIRTPLPATTAQAGSAIMDGKRTDIPFHLLRPTSRGSASTLPATAHSVHPTPAFWVALANRANHEPPAKFRTHSKAGYRGFAADGNCLDQRFHADHAPRAT